MAQASLVRLASRSSVFLDGARIGGVEAEGVRYAAFDARGAQIGIFDNARAAVRAVHDVARRASPGR